MASILSNDFITLPSPQAPEGHFEVMMPIRTIPTSVTVLMAVIVFAAPLLVNLVLGAA
jgi:hypothetical protein